MSSLTYKNGYPYVQAASDAFNYSQSVRLPTNPPMLKLSGQGGWPQEPGEIPIPKTAEDLAAQ